MINNHNTIENRYDLKRRFRDDNTCPSRDDFSALIDSVLVKRDDQFFGKWTPGIGYKTDDIVIFNNTLYIFISAEEAPDCDCDDDCCKDKNPEECCRWQPLQLCADADDGDWVKYDDHTMYAKVFGKIGIGTGNTPKAFFHLKDGQHDSQLMFNPTDTSETLPMLKMTKKISPPASASAHKARFADAEEEGAERSMNVPAPGTQLYVSQHFEGTVQTANAGTSYRVTYRTNTLGFLFKRKIAGAPAGNSAIEQDDMSLMFVTSTPDRPRVGIGTTTPEATLDIKEAGKGQIILDPGEFRDPQIVLLNLHPANAQNYLTIKVGATRATFVTDAPNGFAFRRGAPFPEPNHRHHHAPEENEKNIAYIDGEGDMRVHGIYVEPVYGESRNIHDAVKKLCELDPRRYREDGERQYGFYAENIGEVLPHVCKTFPDNVEGIAYNDLVVLLVKAVQELSEEVNDLKRRFRHSED